MECTEATTVDQGELLPAAPASAKGAPLWGLRAGGGGGVSGGGGGENGGSGGELLAGHCDRWTIPPSALNGTACAMDGKSRAAGPSRRAPGYLHLEWFRLAPVPERGLIDEEGEEGDASRAAAAAPLLASSPPSDELPPSAAGLTALLRRAEAKQSLVSPGLPPPRLAPVLADGGLASGVYVVAARGGGEGSGGGGGGGSSSFPSVRTTATGEVEFSPPLVGSTPDSSAPSPETGAGVTMVDGAGVVYARPYQRALLPAGGDGRSGGGGGGGESGTASQVLDGGCV
jgi:hypothetical protein